MEGISFVKKEGNFNERDFSFKIDSDVFDAVGRVDGEMGWDGWGRTVQFISML